MATTRLIKHHTSRGATALQSMADRFDYGQNPEKTQDGELVAAYMCDPLTADAEFMLDKAKYRAITGREQRRDRDVLCYQIRQSFVPGETDAATALKIGYDLAMRWTKGKYAFFVVAHTDRPHPHVHIYYNSTALDCTRKFHDFWGSGWALRRLSDRICYENNLSVIKNPKLASKGDYRHYGEWQGDVNEYERSSCAVHTLAQRGKPQTYQQQLKAAIDAVLSGQPKDFAAFLAAMAAAGFEHKRGRGGVISFRAQGQERYTRLRASTLGEGYGLDDILAIIEGRVTLPAGRVRAEAEGHSAHSKNSLPDLSVKKPALPGMVRRWSMHKKPNFRSNCSLRKNPYKHKRSPKCSTSVVNGRLSLSRKSLPT